MSSRNDLISKGKRLSGVTEKSGGFSAIPDKIKLHYFMCFGLSCRLPKERYIKLP